MVDLRRVLPLVGHPVEFLRAGVLLAVIHRRLNRCGYQTTASWLDARVAPPPETGTKPLATTIRRAEDLGAVVRAAARLVPDATCLRRSLALRQLLKRHGTAATVRLGVMPDTEGVASSPAYRFHAWVVVGEHVVSEPPRSVAKFVPFELTDEVSW